MQRIKIKTLLFCLLISVSLSAQNVMPDADSIYAHIRMLSEEIGPRPVGSAAEHRAAQWMAAKLKSYGADSVIVMHFTGPLDAGDAVNTEGSVVAGIFRGETDSSIVLGGHLDSASRDIPGANDNASGTATVIELARIWSGLPRHYTMIFASFGGEERGLYGSYHFMDTFADTSDIHLMFSLDMSGADEDIVTLPETKTAQSPAWLLRDAFGADKKTGLHRLYYPFYFAAMNNVMDGAGSDHVPFMEKGIPAIDFTTGINNSPIHTSQDNPAHIYRPMLGDYARLIQTMLLDYQENGIPAGTSSRYVFVPLFNQPIFLPQWTLWIITTAAFVLAVLAFLKSRKERLVIVKKDRMRFSGWKTAGLGLIAVIITRSGVTILGLLKGVRYPWITHIDAYLWLTLPLMLLGGWAAVRLAGHWRLSRDAYVFSKRALVSAALLAGLMALADVKFGLFPSWMLLCFALTILASSPLIKIFLTAAGILPMIRLMFHEAFPFTARFMPHTALMGDSAVKDVLPDLVVSLLFFLWFLPFFFQVCYLARTDQKLSKWTAEFGKPGYGLLLIVLSGIYMGFLVRLPAYTKAWRPFLYVEAEYNNRTGENHIKITGTDYLKQIRISGDSLDYTLNRWTQHDTIPADFQADWLHVKAEDSIKSGVKDTLNVAWTLNSDRPWHQVMLSIRPDTLEIDTVMSPLVFDWNKEKISTSWFADPPQTLIIPFTVVVDSGAGLIRKITARYAELPIPLSVESELFNVRYRTEVVQEDTLRFNAD